MRNQEFPRTPLFPHRTPGVDGSAPLGCAWQATMTMRTSALLRAWHPLGERDRRTPHSNEHRKVPLFALLEVNRPSESSIEANNAKGGSSCSVAPTNTSAKQCEGWQQMLSGASEHRPLNEAACRRVKNARSTQWTQHPPNCQHLFRSPVSTSGVRSASTTTSLNAGDSSTPER